ncbi:glycosyltransferase [Syntrophomonas palmitatica]|uniref:glycosyltransferase n=1 Tax=Syntrophomonas palmitatica TaxID=402877 RepID=UPI0006D03F04|nr:glycosyltransferase [Syntrophomonas palmitatica]
MPGQLLRFGLTGLINTLMDFGIFNILLFFTGAASSLAIGLINIVAIGMAAVNSYFLNQCFTFQTKTKSHFSQGLRFAAATIMGLFINTLVVIFATHNLHLFPYPNYIVLNLSKILGAILSASWNFLTYRFWVFQTAGSEASWGKQETVEGLTSIIIPAYNESQRLPARLEQLARILPSYFPVEIIIVDDGSSDNTWQLCEAIRHHYDCISCLSYFPNQGKGKAVRTGMKSARGEFLIFTDADSTFDIEHIKQVAECLHQAIPW